MPRGMLAEYRTTGIDIAHYRMIGYATITDGKFMRKSLAWYDSSAQDC